MVTPADQAARLIEVAKELEVAAAHARISAKHFSENEIPRGCAHAVATEGHILVAQEALAVVAKDHRLKARLE